MTTLKGGKSIIYTRGEYRFSFLYLLGTIILDKIKKSERLRYYTLNIFVDEKLMSGGDDERRGAGDDLLARQAIFTSLLDGDGNGNDIEDEDVSETSTLLPTSLVSSSLTAQPWPRHADDGNEEGHDGQRRRTSWRRFLGSVFSWEGTLRMGMFAAMLAMVGLAVARALKGMFSPGLVGGGGMMMVMCILVNRRELRGRLMS
ncbi:hypothetical protein V8C35DRAFT_178292 [Trichoderma chlorosporum]